MLDTILSGGGYEVFRARNGEEGLFQARESSRMPDLILADIMMPVMDGYEMRVALQADFMTRRIPFIFVTAQTGRADKAKAFGLGAHRYLTKPFTKEEVLGAVQAALADAGTRDRLASLPDTTYTGTLSEASLYSLLDLFYVKQWSGQIEIHSQEMKGRLRFEKGEPVETDIGWGNTWTALEEMLAWREGTFEMERAS
jgi:CheY-like chemotaxis protein